MRISVKRVRQYYKTVLIGVFSLVVAACCSVQPVRQTSLQDGQTPTENGPSQIDASKSKNNDRDQMVEEYRIGPEDVLEVMIWKNADLSRTVIVRLDGKISLPLIGDIQAGGLSTAELKEAVTVRIKDYIAAPEVSVLVSSINSYFYYMLGEVVRPGKYPLKERTTLLQAVSMAGGFTPFASKNNITLIRKDSTTSNEVKLRVRYSDILSSDDPEKNILIQAGDTIVIP